LKTGRIRASTLDFSDAHYGNGIYLTSLSPDKGKERILKNNYGRRNVGESNNKKADWYFVFNRIGLGFTQNISCHHTSGRDVWIHQQDIRLESVNYHVGKTLNNASSSTQFVPALSFYFRPA